MIVVKQLKKMSDKQSMLVLKTYQSTMLCVYIIYIYIYIHIIILVFKPLPQTSMAELLHSSIDRTQVELMCTCHGGL